MNLEHMQKLAAFFRIDVSVFLPKPKQPKTVQIFLAGRVAGKYKMSLQSIEALTHSIRISYVHRNLI